MSGESAAVEHLLRRTEFCARPSRLSALSGASYADAVDDVLAIELNPPDDPPAFLTYHDPQQSWQQLVTAIQWWMQRMVTVPRPVHERLTFMWHGHLTSSWWEVFRGDAMVQQNRILRQHALGSFPAMVHAVSLHPAMLLYLDNASNVRWSPNQNFARELLELFLLGQGNYTESDVEAATLAWTGHNLNKTTYQYQFNASAHHQQPTTLFGVTKVWDGPEVIDAVLRDLPAQRTLASRHVARRMWEHFAHPGPPSAALDAVAAELAANDFDIRIALRTLLLRPEFQSTTARQGLVRSPVDWAVALLVTTGFDVTQANPQWYLEAMGQVPFEPPNVSGWRHNAYWVNTSAFAARAQMARDLTWKLRQQQVFETIPSMSISQAIDHAAATFLMAPLSPTTVAAMTQFLSAQRAAGQHWWQATNFLTMSMLAPELHLA